MVPGPAVGGDFILSLARIGVIPSAKIGVRGIYIMLWWKLLRLQHQFRFGDRFVRMTAVEALSDMTGASALRLLVAALEDSDQTVRGRASNALAKLGGAQVVETLIGALRSKNHTLRWYAADVLGRIGDQRAVEPLLMALNDSDGRVRQVAAQALGRIGDQRAVERLVMALKDSEYGVRWFAASALGRIGDSQAIEPLAGALKDSDSFARGAAATALGAIKDRRGVEPLMTALEDPHRSVRANAAEALDALDWRPSSPAQRALYAVAKGKWREAIHEDLAVALPPLMVTVQEGSSAERIEAGFALASITDTRAVQPIVTALRNTNWNVATGISALSGILGKNLKNILEQDLRSITAIGDIVVGTVHAHPNSENAGGSRRDTVDCAQIKRLSLQELARRNGNRSADAIEP